MNHLMHGFADELVKLAYSAKDALGILRLAKKRQLPKAALRGAGVEGLHVQMPLVKKDVRDSINYAIRTDKEAIKKRTSDLDGRIKSLESEVAKHGKGSAGSALSDANLKYYKGKKVELLAADPNRLEKQQRAIADGYHSITRGRGQIVPDSAQLARLSKGLDPKQKKMFNSIMKGHELDEVQVGAKQRSRLGQTNAKGFGHFGWDVMLREHNRVTTLPSEYAPVKELMIKLRSMGFGEKAMLKSRGVAYGESPRLSRSARKNIARELD